MRDKTKYDNTNARAGLNKPLMQDKRILSTISFDKVYKELQANRLYILVR